MLAVRLVLAAVFAVSAIAKATAPRRTADAARDLGLPAALAPIVGVALPLAEAAVAALLAGTATAGAGGVAATALMTAFTALVAGNLIRGRRPACACFGTLSARAPIGPATLVRNAVLLAASLAVLVAALAPGACSAGCYDAAGARQVAVAAGLAVAAAIAAGVLLIHTLSATVGQLTERVRVLEAAHGRSPGGGTPRPAVDAAALLRAATATVTDADGAARTLREIVCGPGPTLLVLLSARCSACERLRDRLRAAPVAPGLRVVGLIDADRAGAGRTGDPDDRFPIFTDGGGIAEAAGVRAFPSAVLVEVLVDGGLRPVGDVLTGTTAIRRFLDDHAASVAAHVVAGGFSDGVADDAAHGVADEAADGGASHGVAAGASHGVTHALAEGALPHA